MTQYSPNLPPRSQRPATLRRARPQSALRVLALAILVTVVRGFPDGAQATVSLDRDLAVASSDPVTSTIAITMKGAPDPLAGQVGGAMNAAVAHEGHLLLSVGPRLLAIDVQDPTRPNVVGQTPPLPSVISDMAMDASRPVAWVSTGPRLCAVAVDSPLSLQMGECLDFLDTVMRVTTSSGRAWVLLETGVTIGVDVTEPSNPMQTSEIRKPDGGRSVDLVANETHLYRLVIADDTDAPPWIESHRLRGGIAPRPLSPFVLLGKESTDSGWAQLEWHAGKLWVGLIDTLTFLQPEGDSLALLGSDQYGNAVRFAPSSDQVYVSLASTFSDNYGVALLDASDPNNLSPICMADWKIGRYPGVFTRAMAVINDNVWVSSGGGFLTGLTRRDATLETVGTFATVGSVGALDIASGHMYALSDQSAQVISLSEPTEPRHVALLDAGFYYSDVAVEGGIAALGILGQSDMIFDRLKVFNVSTPADPAILLEYDSPQCCEIAIDVEISRETLVYTTRGSGPGKSRIWRWSGASSPVLHGAIEYDGDPEVAHFHGDRLLSAITMPRDSAGSSLRQVQLRRDTPSRLPSIHSSAVIIGDDFSSYPRLWLAASPTHAFLLAEDRAPDTDATAPGRVRLYTVLVSDSDRLEVVAQTSLNCNRRCDPADSYLQDDELYIAMSGPGDGGIVVLDVAQPSQPVLQQLIRSAGGVSGVHSVDGWIYAAAGRGGLNVYERDRYDGRTPTPGTPAPGEATPTGTSTPLDPTDSTPTLSASEAPERPVRIFLPSLVSAVEALPIASR
jgi:hypothetical protein